MCFLFELFLFEFGQEGDAFVDPLVEVELVLCEEIEGAGAGRKGDVVGLERPREDINIVNANIIAKRDSMKRGPVSSGSREGKRRDRPLFEIFSQAHSFPIRQLRYIYYAIYQADL